HFGATPPDAVPDVVITTGTTHAVAGPGDLDGDVYPDVVVGPSVYYGGPSMDNVADLTLNSVGGMGRGFAAGDAGNDGYSDLPGASPNYPNFPTPSLGRLLLFRGGVGFDPNPDLTITGEATGDQFGNAAA